MVAGNGSGDSPGNDRSSLVRAPTRAAYSFADTGRAVILPIRRPEAQRLDRVDPVPNPAHQHELDVLAAPDLLERVDRFDDGGKRRYPDVVDHLGATRAGRALHPVELDEVEAVLDRDLDVVAHSACPELDAHQEAVSGRLAHLFNLDKEIVAAEDVGVARRGAQVDAVGNAADAGELGGFVGEQEERRSCPLLDPVPGAVDQPGAGPVGGIVPKRSGR